MQTAAKAMVPTMQMKMMESFLLMCFSIVIVSLCQGLDHSKGEEPRRFTMLAISVRLTVIAENTFDNAIHCPLVQLLHAGNLDDMTVAHAKLTTLPRKNSNRLSLSLLS